MPHEAKQPLKHTTAVEVSRQTLSQHLQGGREGGGEGRDGGREGGEEGGEGGRGMTPQTHTEISNFTKQVTVADLAQ